MLCYTIDRDGFSSNEEEKFDDFSSMVQWVAKRPDIRKRLDRMLLDDLDNNTVEHKRSLVDAWRQSVSRERECLQEALFDLKIDPRAFSRKETDPTQPITYENS